jgi:hypothetical protein
MLKATILIILLIVASVVKTRGEELSRKKWEARRGKQCAVRGK